MGTYRRLKLTVLTTAWVLASCAATSPEAINQLEAWKGIAPGAKPCCTDLASAVSKTQDLAGAHLAFSAESPHFNFGFGLAPFHAFRLRSSDRVIEVQSLAQSLPVAQGGDAVPRCFDPELVFLDENHNRRPGALLDSSWRFNDNGSRSCYYYFSVPEAAATMVLTTDPARNLQRHIGLIRAKPSERLTSKSKTFFEFAGLKTDGYKSTVYGAVNVRALPNE